MNFITCNNLFPILYKFAAEYLREAQQQSSPIDIRVILNPQMRLILKKGVDKYRENLPTTNKVTIIIPDESGDARPRDIILSIYTTSLGL